MHISQGIHGLPLKFQVWVYSMRAPSDGPIWYIFLYSGSKWVERAWDKLSTLNSIRDTARIVRVQQPISVSQLSLSSDENGGMRVNNTCTTTVYLERGMFSASFNTKTNIVPSELCGFYILINSAHKMECCLSYKKMNAKTKQLVCIDFWSKFCSVDPTVQTLPLQLVVIPSPEESVKGMVISLWSRTRDRNTNFL